MTRVLQVKHLLKKNIKRFIYSKRLYINCVFDRASDPDLACDLACDLDLDLDLPPRREAEWRFRGVGRPAWMPGEPCWAMDGPSRRAHGAGPE